MADRERKRTRHASPPRGPRSPRPPACEAGEPQVVESPPVGERRGGYREGGLPAPSHDEIARRAWELYLARGRTDGRDIDDWLRAEQELSSRGPGQPTGEGG